MVVFYIKAKQGGSYISLGYEEGLFDEDGHVEEDYWYLEIVYRKADATVFTSVDDAQSAILKAGCNFDDYEVVGE